MEKEPVTAKELKEAAEILGTHTRDLLNSNINLKNQISYFERLRDAVVTASRVINEDLTSNEKLRAEAESLKNEIAGLEKTAKLLREDASKAKKDWQAETVKLEEGATTSCFAAISSRSGGRSNRSRAGSRPALGFNRGAVKGRGIIEFTYEQANSVISVKQNPYYNDFYYHQKPDVVGAVNRAFMNQHPGDYEIGGSGNLPPHLSDESILGVKQPNPNPLAPKPPVQPQQGQLSPEHAENLQAMRDYWGFDFDRKAQVARDVYGELVGAGVSEKVLQKLDGMGNSMPVLDLLVQARGDHELHSTLRTVFAALGK